MNGTELHETDTELRLINDSGNERVAVRSLTKSLQLAVSYKGNIQSEKWLNAIQFLEFLIEDIQRKKH